jgi:hypothetical protein
MYLELILHAISQSSIIVLVNFVLGGIILDKAIQMLLLWLQSTANKLKYIDALEDICRPIYDVVFAKHYVYVLRVV